jgi:GLPGLI family protein
MNNVIKILTVALLFSAVRLRAQEFQGVATFQSKTKFEVSLDSSSMNSPMQKQIEEMLKKQMEKTFKLTFDQFESIYKEDESLAPPQPSGGMFFQISSGSDDLYKNLKRNQYTESKDFLGQLFLIKDSIQKFDWQLSPETKQIGSYLCFKASYDRPIEESSFGIVILEEEEQEAQPKFRTITAWYTPQIPVSNGPGQFGGLPGLILELQDGETNILCSQIVINPNDRVKIKEPNKVKEVSLSEFEAIRVAKYKEMQENSGRPGKGGEHGITIKIGN